jgi:hypothetical protein
MDLTGTDINAAQAIREAIGVGGKGLQNPIDPFGPTDLAAGAAGITGGIVGTAYVGSGGESALKYSQDLIARSEKSAGSVKPGDLAQAQASAKTLGKLKGALRILAPIAVGLELLDFGVSAYKCIGSNRNQ